MRAPAIPSLHHFLHSVHLTTSNDIQRMPIYSADDAMHLRRRLFPGPARLQPRTRPGTPGKPSRRGSSLPLPRERARRKARQWPGKAAPLPRGPVRASPVLAIPTVQKQAASFAPQPTSLSLRARRPPREVTESVSHRSVDRVIVQPRRLSNQQSPR